MVIIFFLGIIIYDDTRFVCRRYTIKTNKIKKSFRFVLLSDLHNKTYGKNNQILVKAILEEQPDMVLVSGDLVTAERIAGVQNAYVLLKQLLDAGLPIYYSYGNHEQKTLAHQEIFGTKTIDFVNGLKELGVHFLDNEAIPLEAYGVMLHGASIEHGIYFRRFKKVNMPVSYMQQILGIPEKEQCQILLAHNPDYFDTYAAWGADITLSGHIHGGIMRLPILGGVLSPSFRFFPKYDGGRFDQEGHTLILSRGLGTHTLPIRVFNPAELVIVDVKK